VRHKFELTFLEVSAKNKHLFFFKSLREQNITSPLTGVKEPIGALGSFFDFLLMFFHSSTAFTVYAPFCTVNGSGFLLLAVVNSFHHGLHAVLLSGWQRIAHSSARQRHSQFARHFAQRMAADCSFFRSSTAFPMVCVPISSADGSALLVLPLVNGFHGLHAVLLNRWQQIARTCARQWLSLFARRFARRMTIYCSFFRSSTAFMVCAQYCSTDGSGLLVLPLVNGFHGLRAVLLSG